MNEPVAGAPPAGAARPADRSPRPREWITFAAVAGAAALCQLAASLVLRPAGVPLVAELAAGLAPAAVVIVAFAFYRRLPPGLRASLALLIGIPAILAGVISIANVAGGHPFRSDWPKAILLPAGLVLVALAIRLLWRSRRRGARQVPRRVLIAVGCAVAAFWFLLPVVVALVSTQTSRTEPQMPKLGRLSAEVYLRTTDGAMLAGRYVPSRNGAAVIVFPGSWGVRQARMLLEHGFGVLLLDPRGYGQSEGRPNAYGWGATRDLKVAIEWLGRQPDVSDGRIGGLGLSVGGEQLLEAAAEETGLRAVVSDGAGQRSVREALLRGPRGWLSLPMEAVQTAALALLTGQAPPPSLTDVVARISPRPILLIHAEHGQGGEDLQPEYYRAAREPKDIWLIEGATHTDGIAAAAGEYERRVIAFFDAALR